MRENGKKWRDWREEMKERRNDIVTGCNGETRKKEMRGRRRIGEETGYV